MRATDNRKYTAGQVLAQLATGNPPEGMMRQVMNMFEQQPTDEELLLIAERGSSFEANTAVMSLMSCVPYKVVINYLFNAAYTLVTLDVLRAFCAKCSSPTVLDGGNVIHVVLRSTYFTVNLKIELAEILKARNIRLHDCMNNAWCCDSHSIYSYANNYENEQMCFYLWRNGFKLEGKDSAQCKSSVIKYLARWACNLLWWIRKTHKSSVMSKFPRDLFVFALVPEIISLGTIKYASKTAANTKKSRF